MREKRTHSRTREKMNRKRKGWKEEEKKRKTKQIQLIDSNRNSAGVEQATTNAKPFSCAVPAWSSLCWLDVHTAQHRARGRLIQGGTAWATGHLLFFFGLFPILLPFYRKSDSPSLFSLICNDFALYFVFPLPVIAVI
jgi:hypothetical protein